MTLMTTKKTHDKFQVPNFGAKSRKRVPKRWRKPRGIDSKIRVEKKGHGKVPKVGYKNPKEIRHARPDGFFEVLVQNEKDLLALKGAKGQIAVFSHSLSRRKRNLMQKVADKNGIGIANRVKA